MDAGLSGGSSGDCLPPDVALDERMQEVEMEQTGRTAILGEEYLCCSFVTQRGFFRELFVNSKIDHKTKNIYFSLFNTLHILYLNDFLKVNTIVFLSVLSNFLSVLIMYIIYNIIVTYNIM